MIVHSIRNLDRQTGGAPVTVLRLLQAAAQRWPHHEWQLLAEPGANPLLDQHDLATNARWQPVPLSRGSHSFSQGLQTLWQQESIALIHDHGIWLPNNRRVAQFSCRAAIPRVVSTHGMLEPWAWQYKTWKKRLAWHGFQHRDLRTAQALHATSQAEAEGLQRLLLQVPVAVIPWGVDLPPAEPELIADSERSLPRQVLFLSRLHPKKGLLNLVEAWQQLPTQGWQLTIAGPDEIGHQAVVKQRVEDLKLRNVVFVGAVEGDRKWRHYRQADLFVLPTYSENFGLVIAEALAAGTPVITTQAAPWADLANHRCGWWIEVGVAPLVEALRSAMAMDALERKAMGQRGEALIRDHYTWPRVAEQMLSLYGWLLGLESKPQFVADAMPSRHRSS